MVTPIRPSGRTRRSAVFAAVLLVATFAVLAVAARAGAAETIYWDNLEGNYISFSGTDGSGGGVLNLPTESGGYSEAMAYDPANGRMYVAAFEKIVWTAVDGSGSGVLSAPGANMEGIEGIAIDPRTQTIYWANDELFTDQRFGSIGWAHLDGSGGGTLDTEGATTREPRNPVIDTADNRVYWVNGIFGSFETFSWADLDGEGAGDLSISGGPTPEIVRGLVVDPAAGRLYWLNGEYENEQQEEIESLGWTNLSGVGGGEVESAGAVFNGAQGLAFDPGRGRFYWANRDNRTEKENALGTASLAGGGGGITPAKAPVAEPWFPVVLKSPSGAGAPQLTRNGTALSCSQGAWSQDDYPGSLVYGAPRSYSYQWLLNGLPIAGATANAYSATAPGSYNCSVTAENYGGTGSQTSGSVSISGAALSMALQTGKIKVKAGKVAKVTVVLSNGGDLVSAPVRVCAALDKKAKKGLKVPYCAEVDAIGSGGSTIATLSIKTKNDAKGTYKFPVQVMGAAANPVTATIKVTAAKKPKKKKK
jgi:hypothetical protein